MIFGSDSEVAKCETQMPSTPNWDSTSSTTAFCSPIVSTPNHPNRIWSQLEVHTLVKAVSITERRDNGSLHWMEIAKKVDGKTAQQCRNRYAWMRRTKAWPNTIAPVSRAAKRPAVKQELIFDSPAAKRSKSIVAGGSRSA